MPARHKQIVVGRPVAGRLRRRRWIGALRAGAGAMGQLIVVLGASLAVPSIVAVLSHEPREALVFLVVGVLTAALGLLTAAHHPRQPLDWRSALLLCVGGWSVYSLIGALPVFLILGIPYIDAAFEGFSGFTTTGFTILTGLDHMPRSLLFWRVQMQWMGGLGVLSFFLLVSFPGAEAFRLMLLEGPKTLVERPAPGVRGTTIILWRIYIGLTALNLLALLLLRVDVFNAITYALSTSATGGFGMQDANLGFFHQSGHPNALGIEIATMVFMLLSGVGFLSHHLLLSGQPRHALYGIETRTYWGLLLVSVTVLVGNGLLRPEATQMAFAQPGSDGLVRAAFFQSASLLSGAGLATRPLSDWATLPAGFQVLLLLMLIGGCVGSTAGGLKVLRLRVLRSYLWHSIKRSTYPTTYTMPFVIGGARVPDDEVMRMVVVALGWLGLSFAGSLVTALCTQHTGMASFSVALSAVSNMGPSLVSPQDMVQWCAGLKIVYIILMLAGRLEILPVLTIFTSRVWQ